VETGRADAPLDELRRVVESETRILVLDVVVRQKLVNLLRLRRVVEVDGHPGKVLVKGDGLLRDEVSGRVGFERAFVNVFRLCGPEEVVSEGRGMKVEKGGDVLVSSETTGCVFQNLKLPVSFAPLFINPFFPLTKSSSICNCSSNSTT
jgi:hypothetical protein